MKVIEFKAYFSVKGFTETIEADLSVNVPFECTESDIYNFKMEEAFDWLQNNVTTNVS